MKNVLFSILFFNSLFLFSQYMPKIEKQKTIGGNLFDELSNIMQSEKDIIVTGFSNSDISSDKTENSRGGYDYWIMKLDTSFNIIWQKTIGGANEDRLYSSYYVNENKYVVCGGYSYSDSSFEKTQNSKGFSDYWIVVVNTEGEILWQKTIGGSAYEFLKSVIPTKDNGILLAGYSNSNISGDKTENNFNEPLYNYSDYWIVRLDSNGNILWQKTIGGSDNDEVSASLATQDGGFIIGGTSKSSISGNKTSNTYGGGDYWVVRLDSIGNTLWQKNYGGSGNETLYRILHSESNGFYLIGTSTSGISGNKTTASKGSVDIWVIKIDSVGNILWQKSIGGNGLDYVYDAQPSTNGIIIGSGTMTGVNGDKTEASKGMFDGWFFKLNSYGDIQWQKSIGGINDDRIYSILNTKNGGHILGCLSNSDSSADKNENSRGNYDYWMIKLNANASQVYGHVYQDLNYNDMPDVGDIFYDNIKIQLSSKENTLTHLSNNGGKYHFSIDTGSYSVQCISEFNYFSTIPNSVTITNSNMGDSNLINFKVYPVAQVNDGTVELIKNGIIRPNKSINYTVNYTNASGRDYNGRIKLKLDSQLVFQNADVQPFSIVNDTIIWTITALPPYTSKKININIIPVSVSQVGKGLKSYCEIYNDSADATPLNNKFVLIDTVRASLDPNNKEVYKTVLSPEEILQMPFLYYIVYFQNIGNDTAFDVIITDTLDNNLDWATFQPITASHNFQLSQINNRYIQFDFLNIKLPDSTTNEKGSHGFVAYKIRTKNNLQIGSSILNKASIVFDFNPPILTNTTKTVIIDTKAGRDTVICQGDNITLTASGATTYQWSTGVGTPSATVSPLQTTQYIVAGIVSGVVQKDTVIVSVKPLPTINLGNDKALCSGDSIVITAATNATSLLWNTNDTAHSIIIKPTVTANYSVIANLNGCKNTDAISVFVKPLPNVAFTKTQNGAQVQFSAPGGNTSYHWSFGDTTTSTQQNPLHTYTKNGKFYVTLTAGLDGCTQTKTDSVSITITAITNQLSVVDKIQIAPNPVAQFLSLDMEAKKATDFNVTLLNVNGQVVFTKIYNKTSVIHDMLDTHELSSGVYLLQIQAEGEQAVFRIIKK